jgi:hypothetical protein
MSPTVGCQLHSETQVSPVDLIFELNPAAGKSLHQLLAASAELTMEAKTLRVVAATPREMGRFDAVGGIEVGTQPRFLSSRSPPPRPDEWI